MTAKEVIETQDKSLKGMPIVLWARFVGKVKSKPGRTITQVMIELISKWLAEEEEI
jgi:hypothetical protein